MNTIETLESPFKHLVMTIGELPTTFVESMSYYETIAWLVDYIKNKVIPPINNNAEAIKEIQAWISTLDLQDEVDNKLDEMAESGELADIIAQYLQLAGVLAYNTVADMAAAENLADGSIARTLGINNYKDGDGSYYKIRTLVNTDVIDGYNLVGITSEPTLVAERIDNPFEKKLEAYYLYGSSTFGDSTVYLGDKNIIVDFGNDNHTTNDFLSSKGVTKIDAIVITHYHDDHIGGSSAAGLSAVLANANIDFTNCVAYLPHKGNDYSEWTNPTAYETAETTVKGILTTAGIECVEPDNEDEVVLTKNIKMSFYNIGADFYADYYDVIYDGQTVANNFSMMTLIDAYGKRFFNGGDMEAQACANNYQYLKNVDVYHTLHHGIVLASPIEWNTNLAPKYAVITRRGAGVNGVRYSASDVTAAVSHGAILIDTVNSAETEKITVNELSILSTLPSDAPYTANVTTNPTNAISEPVDLNDLVACGTYYVPTGGLFAQCTHIPPAVINTGSKYTGARIDVISTTNAVDKEGVRQIVSYQNLYTGQDEIFYRAYVGANNTWNEWRYIKPAYPNNTDVNIRVVAGVCWVTGGAKDLTMWIPFSDYQYTDDTPITINSFSSATVRIPSGGYLIQGIASTNPDYTISVVKGSSQGFFLSIKKTDDSAFSIANNTCAAFEIWNLNFKIGAL